MSGGRPIRVWSGWACMLALGIAHAQAAAPASETSRGSAEESAATRVLVAAAERALPPALRSVLSDDAEIVWRDLPDDVHGRQFGRTIALQRDLLPAVMAGHVEGADSPALRALIHELAHRYDRLPQGGLSSDPRLRDLAGWPRRVWPWGGRDGENRFVDRSPDAYELHDPREFVAVNLEHFLLDPAYACRRPALFRYFVAHLQWTPTADDCATALPFVEADEDATAALAQIDPARVAGIDYLLAEGNAQPMSRWGHSMLRLVICAPGRPRGPDCRLDLAHHRVLSFRAFVGDVQISSWRGLTGSYPSRLFLLPLEQIIDEYARTELRGLQSIPLRLGHDEIAAVLAHAVQMHWSYDGRYYFLGNNCAVETWRLLQVALPQREPERWRSITPTDLLKNLEQAGIAEVSVLADPEAARRLGYYFEPMSARYAAMFDVARRESALPADSVEAWIALPPRQRRPWLAQDDLRTLAALLVLEEAARRQQELRARDVLKRQLLSGKAGSRAAQAAVRQWLRDGGFLSRPAELVANGYGIPQDAERERAQQEVLRRAADLRHQDAALKQAARDWLPPAHRQALDDIDANLATLGESLRRQVQDAR